RQLDTFAEFARLEAGEGGRGADETPDRSDDRRHRRARADRGDHRRGDDDASNGAGERRVQGGCDGAEEVSAGAGDAAEVEFDGRGAGTEGRGHPGAEEDSAARTEGGSRNEDDAGAEGNSARAEDRTADAGRRRRSRDRPLGLVEEGDGRPREAGA